MHKGQASESVSKKDCLLNLNQISELIMDSDSNESLGNVVVTGDETYCEAVFSYSKTNKMHQFLTFILSCSSTLRVSDGLSVHHQESKTVYTATGICQTDSADCMLAGMRWNWFSRLLNQFHLIPASKQ
jgi:hypothetical protein